MSSLKTKVGELWLTLIGLSLQSLNTRFLLMSHFELDVSRILSMELFARDLIYNDLVSFPIFSSGVTFNNIRFEGKC